MIKYLENKNCFSKVDWHLYFIYFYIFITPWHFSKSQTSILSVVLFLWTLIKYRKKFLEKFLKISKFLPLVFLFLFILYQCIAALWSEDFSIGFNHVVKFNKYYFLFIPAILVSLNKENAIKAVKVLIISLGLYSLYSIFIYYGIIYIEGSNSSNPKGHLRYLIVSQYMAIAFFSAILLVYYTSSKKEKILFLLISLVSIFALFINNSRTAQLGLFLTLFVLSFIFFKKNINTKLVSIFLIVLIGIIYLFLQDKNVVKFKIVLVEAKNIIYNQNYKGSFGLRLYFNKVGIEIFKDNFLLGTGPKDNRLLLQKAQRNDSNYKARIINHFHSEHMDTLTAYGLIGYGLLVSSIVYLISLLRYQVLYYYTALAVFLTLFFNSFANKTLSVKPLNYVYILFFILFAIIAYKSKENQKVKIENNS